MNVLRFLRLYRFHRPLSMAARATVFLSLLLILTVICFGDRSFARAQERNTLQLPAEIPQGPFQSPSAAAITEIMRREGLLPKLETGARLSTDSLQAEPGQDTLVNNPNDDTPERTTQSEVSLAVRGIDDRRWIQHLRTRWLLRPIPFNGSWRDLDSATRHRRGRRSGDRRS